MYSIYMHECPNGKKYIGQTKQKCADRWRNGCGYHNNAYFDNAIKKYGWENIKHTILATTEDKDEAGKLEKYYISLYDTTNREKGFNHSIGGTASVEGYHHTEESKKKISESSKRRKQSEKNIISRRLAKIRSVKVYDFNYNLIAICESLTDAEKLTGVSNANISACCKGKYKQFKGYVFQYADDDREIVKSRVHRKPVNMYSLDGTLIKQWGTIKEASKELGIADTHISDCCKGRYAQSGGYIWKYA